MTTDLARALFPYRKMRARISELFAGKRHLVGNYDGGGIADFDGDKA